MDLSGVICMYVVTIAKHHGIISVIIYTSSSHQNTLIDYYTLKSVITKKPCSMNCKATTGNRLRPITPGAQMQELASGASSGWAKPVNLPGDHLEALTGRAG